MMSCCFWCCRSGSSGYDPPRWPPVGLEWVYRDEFEYAPQVSVVLGALAFAWLVQGLLESLVV